MKKIILKCIIFILILIVILALLSKIVVPKNNTKEAGVSTFKTRQLGILAEPENTIDIIMAGDSEAYTSFIPLEAWHEYGYTTYVCGSPGQRLPTVMSLLQQALEKQNPKILMLEANTIYKRNSLAIPIAEIAYRVFPIVQYHDRWKTLTPEDFYKDVEYTNIQRDKGFYYSTKIDAHKNKEYMKETDKASKVQKTNQLYVKLIKKYCDARGIEFILYSTPASANWTTKKHNGIQKLADSLGVEYIDMNLNVKEIGIDWKKDSRDKGDHLNYTGSLKTTKYLAKLLKENKDLPDHRSDPNYKDWDKYYKKFIKKVNK